VPEELKRSGVVVTLGEIGSLSAGVEEMLVYNFFSEAPEGLSWRLVDQYLATSPALPTGPAPDAALTADKQKALLAAELKSLHLIISRAGRQVRLKDLHCFGLALLFFPRLKSHLLTRLFFRLALVFRQTPGVSQCNGAILDCARFGFHQCHWGAEFSPSFHFLSPHLGPSCL